jgi:hypothetical protein
MNAVEAKLGKDLQKALADVDKWNDSWCFMELRGSVNAAKIAIVKRDKALDEVDRLRRALWKFDK